MKNRLLKNPNDIYTNSTINSSSVLHAFSHKKRFSVALKLIDPRDSEAVLDYGTGDGYMVKLVSEVHSGKVVGYTPVNQQMVDYLNSSISNDNVSFTRDLSSLKKGSFSKICCLEVLEHLPLDSQRIALCNIKSFLKEDGRVVISVPLEVGFASLIKNSLRIILRRKHPPTNFSTITKSLLGMYIERPDRHYIASHIGFRYKTLVTLFDEVGLSIEKKAFSPFSMLGTVCNSQIFFVLKKSL